MPDNTKNLQASWHNRSASAKQKALTAIEELKLKKEEINFNNVHLKSGVSKHFLYKDEEVRSMIEAARKDEEARRISWHSKYDKTSRSKDVVIETKDKYIAKLEAENKLLRKELNQLRAMIYEKK